LLIDADTTVRAFTREVRQNLAYYHLARGVR
jgi:L-arabinose isomerase